MEELSYIRGEPVRMREETWATASSRESPTAPFVVRGVPIIPDTQFRKDDDIAIIYLIGEPNKNDRVIPDTNSEVRLKPNDAHGHAAAFLGVCVLVQGEASPSTIIGEKVRTIDYVVAAAKPFTILDEPSQCIGPVGRFHHGSARHSMDIFHGSRAEH